MSSHTPGNAPAAGDTDGSGDSDGGLAGARAVTSRPAGAGSGRALAAGIAATLLVLIAAGFVAVSGIGVDVDRADRQQDSGTPPTVEAGEQPGLAERVAPTESAPLPEMTLETFAGDGQISTVDYRGKPLILNFWASWCPPCVEEMPDLEEISHRGAGHLEVLGVNLQDDRDKAVALIDSLGVSYDLAIDTEGALFAEVEGFGMPTTLFIDASGDIQYRYTGPLDASALSGLASEHLDVEISPTR